MPELLKLERTHGNDVLPFFIEILSGNGLRAMEAAKALIGAPDAVPVAMLTKILLDPQNRDWSRVAAAYVLGFVPVDASARRALRQIARDARNTARVRTHAVEAIGNQGDRGAISILKTMLRDQSEQRSVRRWCEYALAELNAESSGSRISDTAGHRTSKRGTLFVEAKAS